MRRSVGVVAFLLLTPLAYAQEGDDGHGAVSWTHAGGSAARSGVADVAAGPLDVLARFNLTGPGVTNITVVSGLFPRGDGLIGLFAPNINPDLAADAIQQSLTEPCRLFVVPDVDDPQVTELGTPFACGEGARMDAVPAGDLALVCVDGPPQPGLPDVPLPGSPLERPDLALLAFSATTGELAWRLWPEIILGTRGSEDQNDWFCSTPAVDQGRDLLVVPWSNDGGNHRITAYRWSTREELWSTIIPARDSVAGPIPRVCPPDPTNICRQAGVAEAEGLFRNIVVTITPTGIVLKGVVPVAGPLGATGSAAWLSFNGTIVGVWSHRIDQATQAGLLTLRGTLQGSEWAASQGSRAAALVGPDVVLIDALQAEADIVALSDPAVFGQGSPAPAWSRNALVVPAGSLAYVIDPLAGNAATAWHGAQGAAITALLLDNHGNAYFDVVSTRTNDEGNFGSDDNDLHVVQLPAATTVQQLPLDPFDTDGWPTNQMLPLPGGRLLTYGSGGPRPAVLVGPRPVEERPFVHVSDAYPDVRSPVVVEWTPPAGRPAASALVAWGDGLVEPWTGASMSRAYSAAGTYGLRVTTIQLDGTTSTGETLVHVGATPPSHLNFVQRQFSPERQNFTYFLLGLLVTAVGALVAIVQKRRHRSMIEADLVVLDRLEEQAGRDPREARRDLADYERGLRERLAQGKMRDADYGILDRRVRDILHLMEAEWKRNKAGRRMR